MFVLSEPWLSSPSPHPNRSFVDHGGLNFGAEGVQNGHSGEMSVISLGHPLTRDVWEGPARAATFLFDGET